MDTSADAPAAATTTEGKAAAAPAAPAATTGAAASVPAPESVGQPAAAAVPSEPMDVSEDSAVGELAADSDEAYDNFGDVGGILMALEMMMANMPQEFDAQKQVMAAHVNSLVQVQSQQVEAMASRLQKAESSGLATARRLMGDVISPWLTSAQSSKFNKVLATHCSQSGTPVISLASAITPYLEAAKLAIVRSEASRDSARAPPSDTTPTTTNKRRVPAEPRMETGAIDHTGAAASASAVPREPQEDTAATASAPPPSAAKPAETKTAAAATTTTTPAEPAKPAAQPTTAAASATTTTTKTEASTAGQKRKLPSRGLLRHSRARNNALMARNALARSMGTAIPDTGLPSLASMRTGHASSSSGLLRREQSTLLTSQASAAAAGTYARQRRQARKTRINLNQSQEGLARPHKRARFQI